MSADRGSSGTEFGDLLRRQRLMAGLSQEDLAERSGLSARTISNMERGRTARPYRQSVQSLADALELPPSRREQMVRSSRRNAGMAHATEAPGTAVAAGAFAEPPEPAPVATALRVRYSLPPDTAAFTGRSGELSRITAALSAESRSDGADGGVIAIRAIGGMPGVGKTALAVHAAHLAASRFPDRQLFIDLYGHTPGRDPAEPGDVLAGLLTATGVDPRYLPAGLDGRAALWRDKMAGQRALLVLDNAASSAQVAPLLPGSAGCLVLVTSRRHLADLPGVVVPVLVEVLPPEQAWEMFARLAPRAVTDPAAVAELTALAGYLPLAIGLLARVYARHPVWTLADLVAETRAQLLTLTAEHVSIAAAFEVSRQHLQPECRQFFDCLGLHLGTSMDAYSAGALTGAGPREAARLLDRLHAEGLLTETSHRRYGMHDLIRRHASDHAARTMTQPEREAAVRRLLDYYQHAAARADALLAHQASSRPSADPGAPPCAMPDLADPDRALAWARTERPALLACLDFVTAAGHAARVVGLTAAMAELLRLDGPWPQALTRHAAAARAAADLGDQPGQAYALLRVAELRQLTGDHPAAARVAAEALSLFGDLHDRSGQVSALYLLGFVRMLTSDYPAASQTLTEALGIARDAGDRLGQGTVLLRLSEAMMLTEDYQGEAGYLTEALAIFRDLDDRHGQARALIGLQAAQVRTGDYSGAARDLAEAAAILDDLGDRLGQADALLRMGNVQMETASYRAAARTLAQALATYCEFGNRIGQANTVYLTGELRLRTGDLASAAETLTEALAMFRGVGQRLGQANVLNLLGEVRLSGGDYAGAATELAQALEIHRDTNCRLGVALTLTRLGCLRRLTGDYPAAAQHLAQSLELCRDLRYRSGEAEALNETGTLHRARGNLAAAADCHQMALDVARQIGKPAIEARALAEMGRCSRAAGDVTAAAARLSQAQAIFQRIGAADAAQAAAELDDLTQAEAQQTAENNL